MASDPAANTSKRFKLDRADAKKLAVSFGLGLCGFISAWFAKELVPALEDDGGVLALLVAAGVPILVNAARKWLKDNSALCIAALCASATFAIDWKALADEAKCNTTGLVCAATEKKGECPW